MTHVEIVCPICKSNTAYNHMYQGVDEKDNKPIVIVRAKCRECSSYRIIFFSFPEYYKFIAKCF